jgi:hypothetical protein
MFLTAVHASPDNHPGDFEKTGGGAYVYILLEAGSHAVRYCFRVALPLRANQIATQELFEMPKRLIFENSIHFSPGA